jgi:hypothetical protein
LGRVIFQPHASRRNRTPSHIAGDYLLRYVQEASWREDNRSASNGKQVNRLAALVVKNKPSVDFSGYWQRHISAQ